MIRTPGAGRGADSSACLFAVSDRFEPAVNPLEDSVTLSGVSGAAMEEWRQCGRWLIDCKVLPPNHRVVWPSAAVFDLAQALRDGVLLCQMLHNLSPGSVDLKEINFRPQMSQFLCLKNIRTFLKVCHDKFGLRNSELFDPFDLFDVRDFGKTFRHLDDFPLSPFLDMSLYHYCLLYRPVISALSRISHHSIAQIKGIRPFPSEDTALNEDDVYRSLEELADEHDLGEDDIYDCVPCDDDGDDIYEDIIKKMGMTEEDKRNCCLVEIQETEAKYYKTLEDVEKNYMIPLKQVFTPQEMEAIFVNLEDVIKVHSALLRAIDLNMLSGGSGLGKIFLEFKERLLIYGLYCSHMENAQKTLDEQIATREDECTMKVQEGKFKLQDLLVVPMQRVLKYHLLLKELLTHSADRPERQQLKESLEAMQQQVKLEEYGRPKIDGELKVCSIVNRTKQDRYIFLFDKVVIVCKRKGYSYELKEIIELQSYKMSDDPMNNRDMKKGIFYQGYYCSRCGTGAHKECLEVITICKISPKMVAVRNYHGTPAPPGKTPLCFQTGEFIELLKGDPDTTFAGNMERQQADNLLKSHSSGTYLIRERTAEAERASTSPLRAQLPFVFTPRVVSSAVARYNFAARDMRELSLREGDIVKIYSKIGGDQGWWKGEANGRQDVLFNLCTGKKKKVACCLSVCSAEDL
ncbi:hypothetical protein F7725_015335 [Dissostichus mawsoni]|uniref:Vav 2 guanine nucleotide exchange factor n=1 Tax=Dissostichus mawsoni TaxID=36200 RepID=A0A7J5YKL2_DISMA|nr:hypothetical protein F7725_015335 [Dissostichus mawsoni]